MKPADKPFEARCIHDDPGLCAKCINRHGCKVYPVAAQEEKK